MSTKVAVSVSSQGADQDVISMRFGRCTAFLLVDQDQREVIENSAARAGHGAGTGAAAMLHEQGVQVVVSGRFGPKAEAALSSFGIKMVAVDEGTTVAQALVAAEATK